MRFGLHTGQHQATFGSLAALWRSAEAWGFDACYLFDHFVPLHSDVEGFLPEEALSPDGPCLEGTTALAALARLVPRVGVGMMVAGVGYRTSGLLAHTAATIAQAAPGRVEIGIGAGWFEPEYRAFGLDMGSARTRLDALERSLEAFDLWRRGEAATVAGVAHDASILPMRPPPRLWVAGTGERRLIPLAARYADSWNAMYLTPGEFAAKVAVLRAACEAAGRDPGSVECSIALRAFCASDGAQAGAALETLARARVRDPARLAERSLVGDPTRCAQQLARYADAGATHVAVMEHPPYDLEGLELLTSEVFPAFKASRPAKNL
jgi:alkanesulfonate monooxygenase SsuD/methylene tetrahydromethanopterin reductase-like flavin-dependent oxidoreductase (luciferase family)